MDTLLQFQWNHIKDSKQKYQVTFQTLKPLLIQKLEQRLIDLKTSKRGRKRTVDLGKVWDCLWAIVDNGIKMSYVTRFYGLSKGTLYYYFNIIKETGLVTELYQSIISQHFTHQPPEYLITDSFTVKSMDGSSGIGRNPTDRGRKGIKVSLICDDRKIATAVHISSANTHDSKLLVPTCNESFTNLTGMECLADSAYTGNKYIQRVRDATSIALISKPKRMSNGKPSHVLTSDQQVKIIHRNRIEHLNGHIRRFRGLMIKYTKTVKSYETLLFIALLVISSYLIFVK